MSEDDWLSCTYPYTMLDFMSGRASGRKLRLVASHSCRLPAVWRLIQGQGGDRLVAAAERYADGHAGWDEVLSAADATPRGRVSGGSWKSANPVRLPPSSQAQRAVRSLAAEDAWEAAWGVAREGGNLVGAAPCEIMREVFGNPFRPVTADPSWLTPTVVAIASGAYLDQAFDRLPVLADALEDAGCESADLLAHCRDEAPHVRGCWVVDLMLGKK